MRWNISVAINLGVRRIGRHLDTVVGLPDDTAKTVLDRWLAERPQLLKVYARERFAAHPERAAAA